MSIFSCILIRHHFIKAYQVTTVFILALLCCGFTWGKTSEQSCKDAIDLINNQQLKTPGTLPEILERKVTDLCPDGVAQKYLQGMKFELKNQNDQAIQIYEALIKNDEHIVDAQGRLGLLQFMQNKNSAAMVSLTKALEYGGKNPRYHFTLAEILIETNAYPLALYHYDKSVALGRPHDIASLSGIGRAYTGLRNWKESEISFRMALQLSPLDPVLKSELAQTVIRQQRLAEGIQLLRQASALKPDDMSIQLQLSDALTALGETRAPARPAPMLSKVSDEDSSNALVQAGDTSFLRREFPAAIRSYKEAIDKKTSPRIYQKLGDAYLAVGNDDDALKSYQKSLSASPDDVGMHYSIGVILERKGDIVGAIGEYERCISLDKNNGDAHRRLADIYALKGKLNKAVDEYKKILLIAPDNPVIHFKLAKVYQKTGKLNEVVKSLETAIKLDPSNFEPRRELIQLEIKRKNLTYAEKLSREILAINRDDHQERLRLTGILAQGKKYDELVGFLNEETSRYPDDNSSFYRLGLIKEYLKDFQAAIVDFRKSIEIRQTAKAYHALARTYLRISETKNAREALVEATKLDPKKQDSKELLELLDEEYRHAKPITKNKRSKNKKKSAKTAR